MAAAAERGLGLAAAPCNHLSDVVQALGRELAAGRLGRVMMAQAEMDDGMVHRLDYGTWRSLSGAPWPARDEFEVGCTTEHAGYQIGPAGVVVRPGPPGDCVSRAAGAGRASCAPRPGRTCSTPW